MKPILAVLIACGLVAAHGPAHAIWTEEPLTVHATTAMIPTVSACNDGGLGTFVAWHEEASSGSGILRVHHVMPRGTMDPAWPAGGVIACAEAAARPLVGVVADDLGGAYAWWLEPRLSEWLVTYDLYLTRVVNGAVAPGWPARGRFLGEIFTQHVSVIPDAQHGVFAAWTSTLGEMLGVHLGPANTGAGGWGDAPRVLVSTEGRYEAWPQLAPAPDGGIFVGWASISTTEEVGVFHLGRWTGAGSPPGELPAPVTLGIFSSGFFWNGNPGEPPTTDTPLIDVSEDARGGVFALVAVTETPPYWDRIASRLLRLEGDGSPAPDWPAGGRGLNSTGWHPWDGDMAFRVYPDGVDGALAGAPFLYDHDTVIEFYRVSPSGTVAGEIVTRSERVDIALKNGTGMFTAHCHPSGANSQYDPPAHIAVGESSPPAPVSHWGEYVDDRYVLRYGAVAIAATGDDGAVLFWSQYQDRFGLFARRFGAPGPTTNVTAPTATAPLEITSLRFVAGRGLLAAVHLPDAIPARLELFDLQGRRVSSLELTAAQTGRRELVLDAAAPRGVYLARLTAGGRYVTKKVAQLEP